MPTGTATSFSLYCYEQ